MLGLDCWLMCSFPELTGSSVSPLFLPSLAFFQWNPKPCATPSVTDDSDEPQQKETSPFPSLHNEVVASFIHLQRTNPVSGVREELNSILKNVYIEHQLYARHWAWCTKLGDILTPWRNCVLTGSIVILYLHHTLFYDVRGGVRWEEV